MNTHIAHARAESGPLIAFTIFGEPASKANSRKMVTMGGKPRLIKGEKALGYEREALLQIPVAARQQWTCPVSITLYIFYSTERPDLDESLILDILQDRFKTVKGTKQRQLVQRGVYCNDRQVREKHVYHAIDKHNPRTDIVIRPISGTFAPDLFAGEAA